MIRGFVSPLATALAQLLLAATQPVQASTVLHGRVLDVAASGASVAVLREHDLVLLDGHGQVLAQRTWPEDLTTAGARCVLTASGRAWALLGGAVLRQDGVHMVRVAGAQGVQLLAVSPDEDVAVAAAGRTLLATRPAPVPAFRPWVVLPRPAHAVAMGRGGATYVADALGLWRVDAGAPWHIHAGPVIDLAWCAGVLVALSVGRVLVFDPARGGVRVSPAPGASGLRCEAASGSTWLLTGARLWLTRDAGRSWMRRDGVPAPVRSAAEVEGTLWVASDAGLVREPAVDVAAAPAEGRRLAIGDAWRPRSPSPWLHLVPVLQLALTFGRAGARTDVEGWASLSWSLSRPAGRALASSVARERARQAALLSVRAASLAGGSDGESAAMESVLRQLMESLP